MNALKKYLTATVVLAAVLMGSASPAYAALGDFIGFIDENDTRVALYEGRADHIKDRHAWNTDHEDGGRFFDMHTRDNDNEIYKLLGAIYNGGEKVLNQWVTDKRKKVVIESFGYNIGRDSHGDATRYTRFILERVRTTGTGIGAGLVSIWLIISAYPVYGYGPAW